MNGFCKEPQGPHSSISTQKQEKDNDYSLSKMSVTGMY